MSRAGDRSDGDDSACPRFAKRTRKRFPIEYRFRGGAFVRTAPMPAAALASLSQG